MKRILVYIYIITPFFILSQNKQFIYFELEKEKVKYPVQKDSVKFDDYKKKALIHYSMMGYVGVEIIDSSTYKNEWTYQLKSDKKYEKVDLINSKKHTKTKFNSTFFQIDKIIRELENNGYPFAQVIIDQQEEKNKQLSLYYHIDSGEFVVIDKVHIKSNSDFNENTILNIVGIKIGEAYDESKIKNIDAILRSSKLYKLIRPVEVLFMPGKAELYLFLDKSKSSNADGYIGFQQDRVSQKLVLNGYVNLQLNNAFNRGEKLILNWKSNPDKTQNLWMKLSYPHILNTPFGVTTDLNLQKQDTSFIKSNFIAELNYKKSFSQISIFNEIENSNVLLETYNLLDLRTYKKNTIGLKYEWTPQMSNKFKFYHPMFYIQGGFFNYQSDTIQLKTNAENYRVKPEFRQKIDLFKYFHLYTDFIYETIQSSYDLSRNELVFFGGLRSVRGFYELELFGNDIFIIRNSFEFQPLEVLSFQLIYDYSQFKTNVHNFTHSYGFGFGFLTDNSKLEIIIANGVLNDFNPDFTNTKVHIGFVSNF